LALVQSVKLERAEDFLQLYYSLWTCLFSAAAGYPRTGNQDTKAFREAIFISVLAATQQIHIQRLSPENKGAMTYIAF
jgi:hypothetical protein